MELLVQLVIGLAWPLSIFGIVLLLRKELTAVIGRLTKLRYKDLEAEFKETLRQIETTRPKQLAVRASDELEGWHPLAELKERAIFPSRLIASRSDLGGVDRLGSTDPPFCRASGH